MNTKAGVASNDDIQHAKSDRGFGRSFHVAVAGDIATDHQGLRRLDVADWRALQSIDARATRTRRAPRLAKSRASAAPIPLDATGDKHCEGLHGAQPYTGSSRFTKTPGKSALDLGQAIQDPANQSRMLQAARPELGASRRCRANGRSRDCDDGVGRWGAGPCSVLVRSRARLAPAIGGPVPVSVVDFELDPERWHDVCHHHRTDHLAAWAAWSAGARSGLGRSQPGSCWVVGCRSARVVPAHESPGTLFADHEVRSLATGSVTGSVAAGWSRWHLCRAAERRVRQAEPRQTSQLSRRFGHNVQRLRGPGRCVWGKAKAAGHRKYSRRYAIRELSSRLSFVPVCPPSLDFFPSQRWLLSLRL